MLTVNNMPLGAPDVGDAKKAIEGLLFFCNKVGPQVNMIASVASSAKGNIANLSGKSLNDVQRGINALVWAGQKAHTACGYVRAGAAQVRKACSDIAPAADIIILMNKGHMPTSALFPKGTEKAMRDVKDGCAWLSKTIPDPNAPPVAPEAKPVPKHTARWHRWHEEWYVYAPGDEEYPADYVKGTEDRPPPNTIVGTPIGVSKRAVLGGVVAVCGVTGGAVYLKRKKAMPAPRGPSRALTRKGA